MMNTRGAWKGIVFGLFAYIYRYPRHVGFFFSIWYYLNYAPFGELSWRPRKLSGLLETLSQFYAYSWALFEWSYVWFVWRDTFQTHYIIQGGPEKNATPTINNFKKTRDRMKKLYALLRIKFFSQQDDTKIKDFDEGVLILWPFLISEPMSFSRFALLSQKSQFTYRKCSIVWLPRVKCLLLLCKARPAWI